MTELFCGHLDQMEEIARDMLTHCATHEHGVPSVITAAREGSAVLSISAPPIGQLFQLLTQILVLGMDIDRADISFDTYSDPEEQTDALVIAHFCRYEGRPSVGERTLEYVIVDDDVEIRNRPDLPPILLDSILAMMLSASDTPEPKTERERLQSDLLLVARLQESLPVQCVIPADNRKITEIMALSPETN